MSSLQRIAFTGGGRTPALALVMTTLSLTACQGDDSEPTIATTPPQPRIEAVNVAAGEITALTTVVVHIAFDQEVRGFQATDLDVHNAIIASFGPARGLDHTYSVSLVPQGDGEISLRVPAGVCTNVEGLENLASTSFTFTSSSQALTVTLTSPVGGMTSQTSIPVEITFSEPVEGLEVDDLVVEGGYAKDLVSDAHRTHFSTTVVVSDEGLVRVRLPAGACQDAKGAGKTNLASGELVIKYDTTSPSVTITSPAVAANAPTALTAIPFSFWVSEATATFEREDIRVENGTIIDFMQHPLDELRYLVHVQPSAGGEVILSVDADAFTDQAGNGNLASSPYAFYYDGTLLSVLLTSTAGEATREAPFAVTIAFSEPVVEFTTGDVAVTHGTLTSLTGDGSVFVAIIAPAAEGVVTVSIPAAVCTDAEGAGKKNTASADLQVVYDVSAPTASIASPQVTMNGVTALTTLTFRLSFSEEVFGLEENELTVHNLTVLSLAKDSQTATDYLITAAPIAHGSASIAVVPEAALDLAGNASAASSPFTFDYDATPLEVTLSAPSGLSTNVSPLEVVITFSEEVDAFTAEALEVENGAILALSATASMTFLATIEPEAEGTVSVAIPADVCGDARFAGKRNLGAEALQIEYDVSAPSTPGVTGLVGGAFNQPQTFGLTDLEAGALAEVSLDGGNTWQSYTSQVTLSAEGSYTVIFRQTDTAGNVSSPSDAVVVDIDYTAPDAPEVSGLTAGAYNTLQTLTLTSDETDALMEYSLNGGTTWHTYEGSVPLSAEGEYSIMTRQTDAAGNASLASSPLAVTIDKTPPTVTVASAQISAGASTTATSFTFTFSFNEAVTGFTAEDITTTNASVSGFTQAGNTYSATISPISAGAVVVSVAAGAASDQAGNGNAASDSFTFTYVLGVVATPDTYTGKVYSGRSDNYVGFSVLLDNDQDNQNAPPDLSIISVSNGVGGTPSLDIFNNRVVFDCTGAAGTTGSFEYTITNPQGSTATATVTFAILTPPSVIAVNDAATVQQGGETYIAASTLLANDVGSNLTVISVGNAVRGTVSLSSGTITFLSQGLAGQSASFDYTIQNNSGVEATGTVTITVLPLAEIQAYMFDDSAALDAWKSEYEPPLARTVFNTWGRITDTAYYADYADAIAKGASGVATAWVLIDDADGDGKIDGDPDGDGVDDNRAYVDVKQGNNSNQVRVYGDINGDGVIDERVMQPLNSSFNGFVSPLAFDRYTHEVTLWSPDPSDDDMVGVVVAFNRSESTNHTLWLGRTRGGNAPLAGWGLVYNNGSSRTEVVTRNMTGGGGNWGRNASHISGGVYTADGYYSRIKVVRTGNIIEAWASDFYVSTSSGTWPTTSYLGSSAIKVDLANPSAFDGNGTNLSIFQGKQKYGYCNSSQAISTYLDTYFDGNFDQDHIFFVDHTTGDNSNNVVYQFDRALGWQAAAGLTIQDVLGYVRDAYNPESGKVFTIFQDRVEFKGTRP